MGPALSSALDARPRAALRAACEMPLVFWHLLSLDAPTVATLWTWFIARSAGVRLPPTSLAAMFLAVWILYAADRLLDARLLDGGVSPDFEVRHVFHHRHRRLFRVGIAAGALLLAPLLLTIPAEAIRLYLIAGALLFAWFVLIHAAPVLNGRRPVRLPKEIAVGIFFAAAIFIATVSRAPALRLRLLPDAVLFAALCSLNCLFIYRWEHPQNSGEYESATAHPTTRLALDHLGFLAPALMVCALLLVLAERNLSQISYSIAGSSALLMLLDRFRPVSRTVLRAAADFALLTPLFFLACPRPIA